MARLLPFVAAATWMVYVLYGSMAARPAGSGAASTNLIPRPDLIVHFVLYGIMATLLRWSATAVRGTGTTATWARVVAPVAIAIAYGGLMEVLQNTTDTRSGALDDLLADSAGAVAAILAIEWLLRLRGRLARRTSESSGP